MQKSYERTAPAGAELAVWKQKWRLDETVENEVMPKDSTKDGLLIIFDLGEELSSVPWPERIEDHQRVLTQFDLSNQARNFAELTRANLLGFINGLFARIGVKDSCHPGGVRHLLCWELMRHEVGTK
jgi:hypothetical protein